jgi:hypothetical protein
MAAAKLATLKPGGDRGNQYSGGKPPPWYLLFFESFLRPRLPISQRKLLNNGQSKTSPILNKTPLEYLLVRLLVGIARKKGHDFASIPVNVPYALNAVWFLLNQKLITDSIAADIQHLGATHKISDNPDFQPTVSRRRSSSSTASR